MEKETQEMISKLQLMEQNMQQFLAQKQQFQLQLAEIESALSELEKTETSYKIIGNLMVMAKKDDLKKDLGNKKEMLTIRIKTLEKQENSLKDKSQKLQKEVLEGMKNDSEPGDAE